LEQGKENEGFAMTTHCDKSARLGTDDLLPTRRSLLGRLKNWEDNASWQEFFDTYWRLIYQVALKAGLTEAEAEEVVQETVVSVAKAMKEFRYDEARGSFKGWLLQLTGWRINNQFHKRDRDALPHALSLEAKNGLEEGNAGLEPGVPPELERLWDAEWEKNLFSTALERVRHQANPKHFQIFDLCVMKQKPVKEVQKFLGVSLMEVYLSRHRVARLVKQEVKRLRKRLL
jgi:RNA polymerase sigma factor (sigma-70 family)